MKIKCKKCGAENEVNPASLMGKIKTPKKVKSYINNFKNRWRKKK